MNTIKQDELNREQARLDKIKADGDKQFDELTTIKEDEEAQVQELEDQLANWKQKRAVAAMNDDD
jgi:hypothetical protein